MQKSFPLGPCEVKSRVLEHTSSTITSYDMDNVDFTHVLYVFLHIIWAILGGLKGCLGQLRGKLGTFWGNLG